MWSDEFKVGDKVMICDRGYPRSVSTVATVGKLKITLANGTGWRVRGHGAWGSSTWDGRSIQPYDQAAIDEMRLKKLRRSVIDTDFRGLSDAKIARILAIINEPEDSKEAM